MYEVNLSRKTEKSLNKIPFKLQERILLVLKKLKTDPLLGKKLEGRYSDNYSIRVWPYRIIYNIDKHQLIINIIEIEHRGQAYRK